MVGVAYELSVLETNVGEEQMLQYLLVSFASLDSIGPTQDGFFSIPRCDSSVRRRPCVLNIVVGLQ